MPVTEYVQDLAEVYASTIEYVRDFKKRQQEDRDTVQARRQRTGTFEVGDFVLVLRPEFMAVSMRPGPVSKKLMHRTYDDVYQIYHKINANAYVVRVATTGADPEPNFSNPINPSRLIPAVTWYVAEPEGEVQRRVEILQEDEATYRAGTVTEHGYGGVVKIRWDSDGASEWTDLTKEQYRWVI